jgi:hypothetical protein
MQNKSRKYVNHIEYLIIIFIFLILFILPVLFTRIDGEIRWNYVIKIWEDQILLLPLFVINHWIFAPKLLFKKKYLTYLICILGLIALFTFSYYYIDEVLNRKPERVQTADNKKPSPIPPYAHLLMYSLLIVGVDTGMSFSKKWHENEDKKNLLEKENTEMQLNILRNQISPHFFMNTLNNIYALIDCNAKSAKEAVMELSKMMRYMLYENERGKVKLSKEFVFIASYINLMKIRFADEMTVHFIIPEKYTDIEIPPMLFISYIENAFKYGASYQNESFINIIFDISDGKLNFTCTNTKYNQSTIKGDGGLGLKNNQNRLNLLFGSSYMLSINSSEKIFNVSLSIPLT